MISRLLVLALAAAPEAKLGAWVEAKTGNSRELRFSDKVGAHIVRFEVSPVRSIDKDELSYRSQDLLVVHTATGKELWRAKDFVKDCEFDLALELVEGSIEVTDLDGDGEAEVSFLYKTACRSDVSPMSEKLLMYEGATKYALRGDSKERTGETEYMGGEFKVDPAFQKAPVSFLDFAKAKWKRLVTDVK